MRTPRDPMEVMMGQSVVDCRNRFNVSGCKAQIGAQPCFADATGTEPEDTYES